MRRRVLNVLTVLSLLLVGVTAAVWVRSYYSYDGYSRIVLDRALSVQSLRGRVSFSWTTADPGWRQYRGGGWTSRPVPAPGRYAYDNLNFWCSHRLLGFGFGRNKFGTSITTGEELSYVVVMPDWFMLAACLILPAARAAGPLRRRRRRRRDACPACGYNLTGNTSGVCPECGSR